MTPLEGGEGEGRSTVEVLEAAKARIEDPERWTQGAEARVEQRGREVAPNDPEAACWCAMGALLAELNLRSVHGQPTFKLLARAAREAHPRSRWNAVVTANDGGSRAEAHPHLLTIFDRAISLARAEEAP